jgi:non-ribosomal peptide synthetase component E (peptide arylation enzyme)
VNSTRDFAIWLEAAQPTSLDALFTTAALKHPTRVALVDPPHRCRFADGPPRHLTYAAADRIVEAIARRLRHLGLPRQSVVGIQCPNGVESVLSLLAVLRAGYVPALLPLLWRRSEAAEALGMIGAKVIIAAGRIAGENLCNVALATAVDVFSIRYVCGFGDTVPDGVIPLQELFTADRIDPASPVATEDRTAEIAAVTWETTAQARIPVGRTHAQLLAAGGAVALETQLPQAARILTLLGLSSCAGLACALVPWLLCGGTLLLHQGFAAPAFSEQICEYGCDAVVAPAPIIPELAAEGLLPAAPCGLLAVWHAPERAVSGPRWRDAKFRLIDVYAFGEIGLVPVQRKTDAPACFTIGPATGARALAVSEITRTRSGTLAMRGPMVPVRPFVAHGTARLPVEAGDFVDTGYPCRVDGWTGEVVIGGPPAGLINVGGYRFAQRGLQELLGPAGPGVSLAALPDRLLSHRLVGNAQDREAAQTALARHGANALVVSAFRERRRPRAA